MTKVYVVIEAQFNLFDGETKYSKCDHFEDSYETEDLALDAIEKTNRLGDFTVLTIYIKHG